MTNRHSGLASGLAAIAMFASGMALAGEAGVAEVVVRARHKPKGYDGTSMRVRLPGG